MNKVLLAILLGLAAPLVFILGAELFEVPGTTSLAEMTSGSIVAALYLACCQFWIAPKGAQGRPAKWPTAVAMFAPVLAAVGLIACVETRGTLVTQGLPMLAAAVCGIGAGAVLAARRAGKTKAAV